MYAKILVTIERSDWDVTSEKIHAGGGDLTRQVNKVTSLLCQNTG